MNMKQVQCYNDRSKSYYLAHALHAYFKNDSSISFLKEHSIVKGVNVRHFIGYHHGY